MTQPHAERIAEIEKLIEPREPWSKWDVANWYYELKVDAVPYLLARVAKLLEQIEDCEKIRHEAFGFAIGPDGYLPEAVADAIQDYDNKWRSNDHADYEKEAEQVGPVDVALGLIREAKASVRLDGETCETDEETDDEL